MCPLLPKRSDPHRHAFDRIDLQASDVYKMKAYHQDMADAVSSARDKISGIGISPKIRLDVFEFSAVAYALRIGRQGGVIPQPSSDPDALEILKKRLEKFRKRARNAAVKQLGDAAFRSESERWRAFVQWMRYNVSQFRVPRSGGAAPRGMYVARTKALRDLMAKAWTDRGFTPLSPEDLQRFSRLAQAELRRGRHPGYSIERVLDDPGSGGEFLYEFVLQRIAKYEVVDPHLVPNLCIRQAALGERFRIALTVCPDQE
jgi:hypothetical protein